MIDRNTLTLKFDHFLLLTLFVVASVRPDLAKFCPFGKDLRIFSNIFKVDFVFGKVLTPLWQNFYAFYGWQIFIAEIGQILKNQSGHTA